jgi:hypothetical protein
MTAITICGFACQASRSFLALAFGDVTLPTFSL